MHIDYKATIWFRISIEQREVLDKCIWDEIPPAQRLDMCMLIDELHDTMRACQEVYVEG